jgi:hypothetical protein
MATLQSGVGTDMAAEDRTDSAALALALLHGDAERRLEGLAALETLGAAGWSAIPSALYIAGDSSVTTAVRQRALEWLATVSSSSALIVRVTTRLLLSESSEDLRRQAVDTMCAHPAALADAVPAIIEVLSDPELDSALIESCLAALVACPEALGPHVDTLVEYAELAASEHKALALRALAALAAHAPVHLPLALQQLRRVLRSDHSTRVEKEAALLSVVTLGPAASAAVDDVVVLLLRDAALAVEATQAMIALGDSAAAAAPRLLGRMKSHTPPFGCALIALHAVAPAQLVLVWGDSPDVEAAMGDPSSCYWTPEPLRPLLVVAIDALLERSRAINWDRRWLWGVQTLVYLAGVEALGRWLSESPGELGGDLRKYEWTVPFLATVIESAPALSASSLLAVARWEPVLRASVARRVRTFPEEREALLPALLAWLGAPGSPAVGVDELGRPTTMWVMTPLHEATAEALATASRTRPWLRELLLQRIASFGKETPAGLGDRLAEALAASA